MSLIAVTGSAGFLGSLLRPALLRAGFQVRGIDLGEPTVQGGPGVALKPTLANIDVEADITEAQQLSGAFDGCSTVIHLAGEPRPSASFRDVMLGNVCGTQTVCEEAARAGVSRFVFASS